MVATKHRREQQTNNTKQHKGQGTNYILSMNVSLPSFKIQNRIALLTMENKKPGKAHRRARRWDPINI